MNSSKYKLMKFGDPSTELKNQLPSTTLLFRLWCVLPLQTQHIILVFLKRANHCSENVVRMRYGSGAIMRGIHLGQSICAVGNAKFNLPSLLISLICNNTRTSVLNEWRLLTAGKNFLLYHKTATGTCNNMGQKINMYYT